MSTISGDTLKSFYEVNKPRILERFADFVSLQTISTDPAFRSECLSGANWLMQTLEELGLAVELIPTGKETPESLENNPIVYAQSRVLDPSKPTVLFYGHYDVQPVTGQAWSTDPFVLTEKDDGRLYGRGAQDNKGQMLYFLSALAALKATGAEMPNLKILVEGEEECGSNGINRILPSIADRLISDYLVVCDTTSPSEGIGSLTMSLRGTLKIKVTFSGPTTDLHSGHHGGVVVNPANASNFVLGQLLTYEEENLRVAMPGFYDGVKMPSLELIREAEAYDPSIEDSIRITGVPPLFGNLSDSISVRRGLTPSLDINGAGGGYQGDGFATIIPGSFSTKMSIRWCDGQDPHELFESTRDFILSRTPKGVSCTVECLGIGPAVSIDPNAPGLQEALNALRMVGENGKAAPAFAGGSIPIVARLAQVSGASPLLIGFGLDADNIHGANESFSLEQFRKGFLTIGILLQDLPAGSKK